MRIEHHPKLNIWVREDGCVYLPKSGKHPAHWMYGSKNSLGYRVVGIAGKLYKVHRLVAETFIGPIPEGYEVDHIDRNRSNNAVGYPVGNLRIVTRSENRRNRPSTDRVTERGGTHYYQDARRACRENSAHYRAEHPEKGREQQARYRAKNREKGREQQARYREARCKTHRQVRFSNGSLHWIPLTEALELLKIPRKQRIFNK